MATNEVDELEAVLQLLRKYGFSKCESALMEDVKDKSQLDSSDFQKFVFPLASQRAPVKVQATQRREKEGGDGGSLSSDDDEFVSLDSSTTELCSSDFTNPYGIQTTRPTSRASSDSLSQFGTARVDFDNQNDFFWYREKEEDFVKPPDFCGQEFDGEPSEDKYILTVQTEKDVLEHDFVSGESYLENGCSTGNFKDAQYSKYYGLDSNFRQGKTEKPYEQHCRDYSCSDPLCVCCKDFTGNFGTENYKVRDVHDHHTVSENEVTNNRNPGHDLVGIFDNVRRFDTIKEDSRKNDDIYDFLNDWNIFRGPHEPDSAADEVGGANSDEVDINDIHGDSGESRIEFHLAGSSDPPGPGLDSPLHGDDYEIFNLRIVHRKNRTGFEENKEFPIVVNSMIAGRYYITEHLGSAAFSRVVQAHDLNTGMDVCLKIIKNDKDFFDQSLDEIKLLKFVNKHDPTDQHHILRLYNYFYHQEHLFIVTELLRENLYEFQKYSQESGGESYFTMHRLQAITGQCLEALLYLHDLGIIHCDLKPENVLIKSYSRCEIKVIDLGRSCFKTDNLSLYVQSRSYRAPEVMLGLPYDHKIDLWSVGCILAELYSGEVLFPNEAVPLLLARMIGTLGPIDTDMLRKGQDTQKYFTKEYDLFHINEDTNKLEYIIPEETSLEYHLGISDPIFLHFLKYLLQINPKRRPDAREALQHPWLSHSYATDFC